MYKNVDDDVNRKSKVNHSQQKIQLNLRQVDAPMYSHNSQLNKKYIAVPQNWRLSMELRYHIYEGESNTSRQEIET